MAPGSKFERQYLTHSPEEIHWNAGGPDPDLVRCVESGKIAVGLAVDFGTGLGHDAIYLAKKGFRVLAVDIAPSAIRLAKINAQGAGAAASVDFRAMHIRDLTLAAGSVALINDRGCFHSLPPRSGPNYIDRVQKALAPGGYLLLKVRRDELPLRGGPRRFSRKDLSVLLSPYFDPLTIEESAFVKAGLKDFKAYFCCGRRAAR